MKEIEKLDEISARSDFWNNQEKAQKTLQQRSACLRPVELWRGLNLEMEDIETIIALCEEEKDESLETEINLAIQKLETLVNKAELKAMLSGNNDTNNAILHINNKMSKYLNGQFYKRNNLETMSKY